MTRTQDPATGPAVIAVIPARGGSKGVPGKNLRPVAGVPLVVRAVRAAQRSGAVDLVVQVGAPKNVKRLVQRIGRANHRYDAPSRAVIVPSNRFEVLECRAALDAVRAHDLDGAPRGAGPLDVLC